MQHHEVRRTSLPISADYLTLRQAIVEAVRPYPDAARAVAAALAAFELSAAEEIKEAATDRGAAMTRQHPNAGERKANAG